jgi:hypothetical protein
LTAIQGANESAQEKILVEQVLVRCPERQLLWCVLQALQKMLPRLKAAFANAPMVPSGNVN